MEGNDATVLAEIEAALRRDDPDFVALIERMEGVDGLPEPFQPMPPGDLPPLLDAGDLDAEFRGEPFGGFRGEGLPAGDGPAPAPPPGGTGEINSFRSASAGEPASTGEPAAASARGATARALLSTAAALLVALTVTVAVTLLVGPDLGGLVGVLSITAAGTWGYQRVRRGPGRGG